jgi:hypothetical protein
MNKYNILMAILAIIVGSLFAVFLPQIKQPTALDTSLDNEVSADDF